MARLAGKVALITGGESGIGLATARLFVSEGARVHLVGLDGDKLEAAVADLGEEHALATVADVTDEPAVVRAIAEGVERYGRFDVLFSNAGISGAVAAIGEYPSDEFARTLAVHVLGAFHVLKHGARRTFPTAEASSSPRASSAWWALRGSRVTSRPSTVRSD